MWSSRNAYENDFCPVREDLLGDMYRASPAGLPHLVDSIAPNDRAMLALFCYRRNHLHALALSIAASCNERDLIELGGRVGSTLYALAHDAKSTRTAAPSSYGHRKPITLSTKPLQTFQPMQDDIDDDSDDALDGDFSDASLVPQAGHIEIA